MEVNQIERKEVVMGKKANAKRVERRGEKEQKKKERQGEKNTMGRRKRGRRMSWSVSD